MRWAFAWPCFSRRNALYGRYPLCLDVYTWTTPNRLRCLGHFTQAARLVFLAKNSLFTY